MRSIRILDLGFSMSHLYLFIFLIEIVAVGSPTRFIPDGSAPISTISELMSRLRSRDLGNTDRDQCSSVDRRTRLSTRAPIIIIILSLGEPATTPVFHSVRGLYIIKINTSQTFKLLTSTSLLQGQVYHLVLSINYQHASQPNIGFNLFFDFKLPFIFSIELSSENKCFGIVSLTYLQDHFYPSPSNLFFQSHARTP